MFANSQSSRIFARDEGVVPVYLVDWPIANSDTAKEILRGPLSDGRAEIGVQLHPWVNPPFQEEVTQHNSFAGNLPRELEEPSWWRCAMPSKPTSASLR